MRPILLALVLIFGCMAPAPAQEPPSPPTPAESAAWQPWQLALAKTVTYRVMASGDVLVGAYLLTGDELEALGLVAAVALEKSLLYYFHEMAWTTWNPLPDDWSPVDRSLVKAATYRAISMTNVFGLSYLATESVEISAAFLGISAIYSTGVYFLHEMLWQHYGPVLPAERPPARPAPKGL